MNKEDFFVGLLLGLTLGTILFSIHFHSNTPMSPNPISPNSLSNNSIAGKVSGAYEVVDSIPQEFPQNSAYEYPMQDTYVNHVQLASTNSVVAMVASLSQLESLSENRTPLLYFHNYTAAYYGNSINFWFNLSLGCAAYVLVVFSPNGSPFKIYPNISTYSLYTTGHIPSSNGNLTGVCKFYSVKS